MTEYVDYEKTYQVPISTSLNKVVKRIVETVAWVNVALILLIVFTVILRYGFHRNQMFLGLGLVPLEELQWHLYAVVMMFGLAYAQTIDSHIRIDIIHMNMSKPFQHFFVNIWVLFFFCCRPLSLCWILVSTMLHIPSTVSRARKAPAACLIAGL